MNLGDLYWLKLEDQIIHPYVIIKITEENVTVCALTTNQNKVNMPGNIFLDVGEGNLEKQSIIEVSKVIEVSKSKLGGYIGKLSENRINEILNGIRFLDKTYFGK